MTHQLDIGASPPKEIYPLDGFRGASPGGERLSFTNYYMLLNGEPFFAVSGEFHFSRVHPDMWSDELLKMKMGGVNIVSSYVFWIHHEETEGRFDFTGCRDLRRFAELCGKHGLYLIIRIGPFVHGEARNGGLPDWLYGKPFEVRSTQPGFIECVKRLYERLHERMDGLYFGQGGPIIAAQIDNEYMHSAAPWEMTTGISNEWIPGGSEGDAYMIRLLDLAREAGIRVPFYTCTGWGGAATPPGMMPLWGGYAFRPWIFYSRSGEHPATREYIYQDNHNNACTGVYNFEPAYPPESRPYLCCEMGGGMTCCYYYRFALPYESVDAMANVRLGSGCNMLGYYMYHGGTNPLGRRTRYLNEGQVPKRSYDYQAPLGEFGQARPSYHRLRMLHYFVKAVSGALCGAKTILPKGAMEISPEDSDTLRFAARVTEDGRGFLFLNNYQDHHETKPKINEAVALEMKRGTLTLDRLSLAAGENCVLPFNLKVSGIPLEYATVQLITVFEHDGEAYAFFLIPEGMEPRYVFAPGVEISRGDGDVTVDGQTVSPPHGASAFTARFEGARACFVTLTRAESNGFYEIPCAGGTAALMTDATPFVDGGCIYVEHDAPCVELAVFPRSARIKGLDAPVSREGLFARYTLETGGLSIPVHVEQAASGRYTLSLPPLPTEAAQVLLSVWYEGDIASAFIDGEMISDNFCNGEVWEIGLNEYAGALRDHPITIYITPVKEGSRVNVESAMAGRFEEIASAFARLSRASARAVYRWSLQRP